MIRCNSQQKSSYGLKFRKSGIVYKELVEKIILKYFWDFMKSKKFNTKIKFTFDIVIIFVIISCIWSSAKMCFTCNFVFHGIQINPLKYNSNG